MTQAETKRSKSTDLPEYKFRPEHPFDVISANVQQAHGIVETLRAMTAEGDVCDINSHDLHNTFWALSSLLAHASNALDVISEHNLAELERKRKADEAGGAS